MESSEPGSGHTAASCQPLHPICCMTREAVPVPLRMHERRRAQSPHSAAQGLAAITVDAVGVAALLWVDTVSMFARGTGARGSQADAGGGL